MTRCALINSRIFLVLVLAGLIQSALPCPAQQENLDQAAAAFNKGIETARRADAEESSDLAKEAIACFKEALAHYETHIQAHPEEEELYGERMAQVNSMIFWCGKFTTLDIWDSDEDQTTTALEDEKKDESSTDEAELPSAAEPTHRPSLPPATFKLLAELNKKVMQLLEQRRVFESNSLLKRFETQYTCSKFKQNLTALERKIQKTAQLASLAFDAANQLSEKVMHFETTDGQAFDGVIEKVDLEWLSITNNKLSISTRLSLLSPQTVIKIVKHLDTAEAYLCIGVYRGVLDQTHEAAAALSKARKMGAPDAQQFQMILKQDKAFKVQVAKMDKKAREDTLKEKYFTLTIAAHKKQDHEAVLAWLEQMERLLSRQERTTFNRRAKKATGKALYKIIENARTACDTCDGSHAFTCTKCNGLKKIRGDKAAFSVKSRDQLIRCPTCRGIGKVPCPTSAKRYASKKYKKMQKNYKRVNDQDRQG